MCTRMRPNPTLEPEPMLAGTKDSDVLRMLPRTNSTLRERALARLALVSAGKFQLAGALE